MIVCLYVGWGRGNGRGGGCKNICYNAAASYMSLWYSSDASEHCKTLNTSNNNDVNCINCM